MILEHNCKFNKKVKYLPSKSFRVAPVGVKTSQVKSEIMACITLELILPRRVANLDEIIRICSAFVCKQVEFRKPYLLLNY